MKTTITGLYRVIGVIEGNIGLRDLAPGAFVDPEPLS